MNLTERAEKALLGALLTDPLTIRQVGLAEAGHFASPLHRQIHAALIPREKNAYAGWAGSLSPNAAYARARGVTGDIYLQELLDACPDAPVYAQMVMEAALRRQLALYARRIKYEAANMHHELNRLREIQPEGLDLPQLQTAYPDPQRVFSHLMQLSYALQAHAMAFNPSADPSAAASTAAAPGPAITFAGHVSATVAALTWTSVTTAEGDWHAVNEEQVLAGIIQQCAPADDFPAWLPAEAFRPGPRREIYGALTGIYYRHDPLDPLILDWELAKRHSAAVIQAPAQAPPQPAPDYIAQLSSRTIGSEVFLDSCQDLLASYTQSLQQQALPATAQPPRGPAHHCLPSPARQQPPEPPAGYLTGPDHAPRM